MSVHFSPSSLASSRPGILNFDIIGVWSQKKLHNLQSLVQNENVKSFVQNAG